MTVCIEDPDLTVTLSRPGSGLGSLVLPPACPDGGGLWWNTLALPENALRYTYAPTSAWVPGTVLLAAVADASSVPLRVAARGLSLAGLEQHKAVLAAALGQWSYRLTVTAEVPDEDPVVLGQWDALPTATAWGEVTPARAGLLVAEAAVVIPVNPAGAP